MSYVMHCFMPGHTLEGVIRKVVRHDLPKADVLELVRIFNELNGHPIIRPGRSYKVPTTISITDGEGSEID